MGIAEFVLIILFSTGSGAGGVGSVDFHTLEACQAAEKLVVEREGFDSTVFTLCARK